MSLKGALETVSALKCTQNVYVCRVKTIPPILKKSFVSMITTPKEKFIYSGIFGFAKGSNFLKFVLESLKSSYSNIENYNQLWIPCRTGPIFITSMFVCLHLSLDIMKHSGILLL